MVKLRSCRSLAHNMHDVPLSSTWTHTHTHTHLKRLSIKKKPHTDIVHHIQCKLASLYAVAICMQYIINKFLIRKLVCMYVCVPCTIINQYRRQGLGTSGWVYYTQELFARSLVPRPSLPAFNVTRKLGERAWGRGYFARHSKTVLVPCIF